MFGNNLASLINPGFAGPSQGYLQMLSSIMGGMGNMLPAAPTRQYNLANEWDKIIGMAQGEKSIYDQLMLFGAGMSAAPTWGQGMAQVAQSMAAEKQREKELMLQLRLGKLESLQKQEEADFNRQTALAGLGVNIADKSYNAFNLDRNFEADQKNKDRMFDLEKSRTQIQLTQALANAGAANSTTALNAEKLRQLKDSYESAQERQKKREAGVFRVPDAQLDINGMRLEAAVDSALGAMEAQGIEIFDANGKLTPQAQSAQIEAANKAQEQIVREKMALIPQRAGQNPLGQVAGQGMRGLADLMVAAPNQADAYMQRMQQMMGMVGGGQGGYQLERNTETGEVGIQINGQFYPIPGLK